MSNYSPPPLNDLDLSKQNFALNGFLTPRNASKIKKLLRDLFFLLQILEAVLKVTLRQYNVIILEVENMLILFTNLVF